MGRSISQATHDRINLLERTGRRCKMDCCSAKATWAILSKAWDVGANGTCDSESSREPSYMGYCKKHADQLIRSTQHFGTQVEGDGWSDKSTWRVEVATGGGSKQVQVYHLPARKLRTDDMITHDGRILTGEASFVAGMRADLEE